MPFVVYHILESFLEDKEELDVDYCVNPVDTAAGFRSEKEMLSLFSERPDLDQLFFWNEKTKRKDMVGVCFTKDGAVVFSVTTQADGQREVDVLKKLKQLVGTNDGLISYNLYPEYETETDFKNQLRP